MPALSLANVFAYAIQIVAVVAVGAIMPRLLRLETPGARLAYWRALLLACLLLPVVQPWVAASGKVPLPGRGPLVGQSSPATPPAGLPAGPATSVNAVPPPWSPGPVVGVILLAGIAVRFAWLGLGVLTLARLRTSASRPLPSLPSVDDARELVGADAEFRLCPAISRPVTFGLGRPVVLVPAEYLTFEVEHQKSIASHELLHVRRRDWIQVVGEQILLSLFWFHPAVWWLVGQIDLCREQVVDREVVALLGRRRPYLQALLRLAEPAPRLVLTPASSFLRRAHLTERVTLLLKEVSMSRSRLVVSFVAMAIVVLFGARLAVQAVPLAPAPEATVPGPVSKSGQEPMKAQRPLSLLQRVEPVYPLAARQMGIKDVVLLEVTIAPSGLVYDVRALSGPQILTGPAIDAVRMWQFSEVEQSVTTLVAFNFASVAAVDTLAAPIRVGGTIRSPLKVRDVKPVYPQEAIEAKVMGVVIVETTIDPGGLVRDARILRSIPMLDQAALEAVSQWVFAPTLLNGNPVPMIMTVTVNFTLQ